MEGQWAAHARFAFVAITDRRKACPYVTSFQRKTQGQAAQPLSYYPSKDSRVGIGYCVSASTAGLLLCTFQAWHIGMII
jgi:hypothetical protein